MSNTSDFFPWATAVGANVASVANYQAASIRQQGAQLGIADPVSFNNAMRQATSAAAMVAAFTAQYGPGNALDNGNISNFLTQFIAALEALIAAQIPTASTDLY